MLEWNERLSLAYKDGQQVRHFTEEEEFFILNEVNLSKWDFRYWGERYAVVSGADGRLTKFVPVPSQEKLLQRMAFLEESTFPQREGQFALIIAKARRVGATVLAETAVAHNVMLRSQAKGLVASNEPGNSLELFKILTRIYDNLPPWQKPLMTGRVKGEHLYFEPPLDSDITIGHGAQKNPMGQGVRLDVVHLSEMSTWLEVGTEQVDADMMPAFSSSLVPSSFFIVESTGESALDADAEWFKSKYRSAKKNKGDFRSIFLSWYDRPDIHTTDSTGVALSEDTQELAKKIRHEVGFECSKDQLAWYQTKKEGYEEEGKLDTFLREYPTTDEECFQYSMPCAWDVKTIDKVSNNPLAPPLKDIFDVDFRRRKLLNRMSPGEWDNDPNNRVLIFEYPQPGYSYVMGGDAAYGIEGKDSAALYINRVGDIHSPDVQVAEFSGICQPDELAVVAWILGHIFTDKYNELPALAAIEINGPGLVTQTQLLKWNYPNMYRWRVESKVGGGITNSYGWHTTPGTRPLLTKKGVEAIKRKDMIPSSPFFIREMKTFINHGFKLRNGVDGYEYFAHAPGEFDDRIFAGFIAYYVSHDYDNIDVSDERRKYYEQRANASSGRSRNMQELDVSIDELLEGFEEQIGY